MVEREEVMSEEGTYFTFKDPEKFSSEYRIITSRDGFGFFVIENSVGGKTPKALEGRFTSSKDAEKKLLAYIRTMPATKRAKVNENQKRKAEHDSGKNLSEA